jgi:hypothetical protein
MSSRRTGHGLANIRRQEDMEAAANNPVCIKYQRRVRLWVRFVNQFHRGASVGEAVAYYDGLTAPTETRSRHTSCFWSPEQETE